MRPRPPGPAATPTTKTTARQAPASERDVIVQCSKCFVLVTGELHKGDLTVDALLAVDSRTLAFRRYERAVGTGGEQAANWAKQAACREPIAWFHDPGRCGGALLIFDLPVAATRTASRPAVIERPPPERRNVARKGHVSNGQLAAKAIDTPKDIATPARWTP